MRTNNGNKLDKDISESISEVGTFFQSEIYWFRDYWSNRFRLGRNQRKEGLCWNKNKDKFIPDLLNDSEIIIDKNDQEDIILRDTSKNSKLFDELINPHKLIREYEPREIIVEDGVGHSVEQLPHSDSFAGAKENFLLSKFYSNRKNFTPEIYTQKITHPREKKELKRIVTSITEVLITWLLILMFAVIGLNYLLNIFPLFFPFYFYLIMSIVVATLLFFGGKIIHHITKYVQNGVAFIQFYDGKDPKSHFKFEKDVPKWLESKPYWIFDYIYGWSTELTLTRTPPFIFKKDFERIELWVDSRTGIVEWAVTDYHYRELWYKIGPYMNNILVWIYPDFHTPRFLNIRINNNELVDLYTHGTKLYENWKVHLDEKTSLHCRYCIKSEIGKGVFNGMLASNLANLWWDHWRYPLGADSKLYKDSQESQSYPAVGKQPPTLCQCEW